MAVEEGLGDGRAGGGLMHGVELGGVEGHEGYVFEDDGVVGGFGGGSAPGEGGVAADEDGGDFEGVDGGRDVQEAAGDLLAGVEDVVAGDLFVGEVAGDGDRAVEVVGVGGAEGGDGLAGLGPGGGEGGVGVDDGSDGREGAVEVEVGVEVGGGAEGAGAEGALEVADDHILGAELGVVDAGGLDDDGVRAAVDSGGVAEGEEDEAVGD